VAREHRWFAAVRRARGTAHGRARGLRARRRFPFASHVGQHARTVARLVRRNGASRAYLCSRGGERDGLQACTAREWTGAAASDGATSSPAHMITFFE